MYYIKKIICIVILILMYCFMIDWRESIDYVVNAGLPSIYVIDWLFHLAIGLALGGFFYNDFTIIKNRARKIVISLTLMVMSSGYGLLLLGLSSLVGYHVKVTLFDLSPIFQIILGIWLFLILYDHFRKDKKI